MVFLELIAAVVFGLIALWIMLQSFLPKGEFASVLSLLWRWSMTVLEWLFSGLSLLARGLKGK